jgi:hypothetical protein
VGGEPRKPTEEKKKEKRKKKKKWREIKKSKSNNEPKGSSSALHLVGWRGCTGVGGTVDGENMPMMLCCPGRSCLARGLGAAPARPGAGAGGGVSGALSFFLPSHCSMRSKILKLM